MSTETEKTAARGDQYRKALSSGALNFVSGINERVPPRQMSEMGAYGMQAAQNQSQWVADLLRRARGGMALKRPPIPFGGPGGGLSTSLPGVKLAEEDKTAAPLAPSREELLQQYYGKQLLHSIGAGAGVGVGATALYQLLRGLKRPGKKEKKYNDPAAYGTGSPMFAKEGFDLNKTLGGMLPKHLLPFGAPSGGGGLPSADPYAWRKAWSTAANIGGAGLGAYGGHKLVQALVKAKKKRELAEAVEDARRSYYDALGGYDKAAALDEAYAQMKAGAWLPQGNHPGILGGGLIGGLGGAALGAAVNAYRARKGEKWDAARRGALTGGALGATVGGLSAAIPQRSGGVGGASAAAGGGAAGSPKGPVTPPPVPPKAPGGAPAAATAAAAAAPNPDMFEGYDGSWARRAARTTPPPPPQMRAKGAGVLSAVYNTPQALRTAYLLSILGAGGLGAHYMYNRTKELTEGENLAKAQASRARLKGLPPVWVDPESLAQVKQLAEHNE